MSPPDLLHHIVLHSIHAHASRPIPPRTVSPSARRKVARGDRVTIQVLHSSKSALHQKVA
jgi:hypothetical protein